MLEQDHNYKHRLLYCPTCKRDFENNHRNPQCPNCNRALLKVCFIGGQRITGLDSIDLKETANEG